MTQEQRPATTSAFNNITILAILVILVLVLLAIFVLFPNTINIINPPSATPTPVATIIVP